MGYRYNNWMFRMVNAIMKYQDIIIVIIVLLIVLAIIFFHFILPYIQRKKSGNAAVCSSCPINIKAKKNRLIKDYRKKNKK